MPNRCSACCMDSGRRSLREKIIPELKSSHMPRKMACETEQNPLGVFKCQLCALTAPYSYKGQQPPDCQSVVLLEECYVLRDPFTPDKGRFLIVGSRCSMCGRLECSLFYSKRFCLPCVQDNVDAFPQEIQQDLEKRKVSSTRPAGQRSSQP
ncbi:cysteine-rich DPF motif domain-containing protein 1 isoform X4 [Moschus berezovskii]|uniref:cysteine-rich DPF motif domain-containing protein 1 isoform X4 n=1 Tax=Moschus berezovskii TaxID=68408 RepID=UPI0024446C00|nr:cysteine-rich DPF motif domain-containing protein 1 isoform X4 [Moschus berezovskii]